MVRINKSLRVRMIVIIAIGRNHRHGASCVSKSLSQFLLVFVYNLLFHSQRCVRCINIYSSMFGICVWVVIHPYKQYEVFNCVFFFFSHCHLLISLHGVCCYNIAFSMSTSFVSLSLLFSTHSLR